MKKDPVPAWQDAFKSASLRCGFGLTLTRAMCEFLSAVADGVSWDRSVYGSSAAFPDNFLTTSRALTKRGLIADKPQADLDAGRMREAKTSEQLWCWNRYQLTPAGEHVVVLLKLAGLFVEADLASHKKAKA